jgi:ABC-type amino acid transport substrate-binding protein
MCIWDPTGNQGPVYSFFFDLRVKALSWGVDLVTSTYESELDALELLEQGECDVSVVTAILARNYVNFGGSLDAIGAVRNSKQLEILLATLNSSKLRPALRQDQYEIAAVLPVGPMYAFVNDKNIKDLRGFREKRISALNSDVQTRKLAKVSGAYPLNTTISDFSDLFKKGKVDIVLMPAIAYTAFELEKAMRNKGGIIDIRFFNGMLQAIANADKVGEDFSVNMRRYMFDKTKDIFKLIQAAENGIPKHYWIQTDKELKAELEGLFKDIRLELMIENKLDRRALSLLWRIRCKTEKSHPECSFSPNKLHVAQN